MYLDYNRMLLKLWINRRRKVAQGYFMNMECLALSIAEDAINLMGDNNYYEGELYQFIDDDKYTNNLKQGYIIVTMMKSYVDSSLYSIIYQTIDDKSKINEIVSYNIFNKLKELYKTDPINLEKLKHKTYYATFTNMNSIRNKLIHYGDSFLSDGSGIPYELPEEVVSSKSNLLISKRLDLYFIKNNMIKLYEDIQNMIKHIADDFKININEKCSIFTCDGKGENYKYIEDR